MRQLARVVQATIVDGRASFNDVPDGYCVVVAPLEPKALFTGDACVVFGVLTTLDNTITPPPPLSRDSLCKITGEHE